MVVCHPNRCASLRRNARHHPYKRRFGCRPRVTTTRAMSCRLARRGPIGSGRCSLHPLLATGSNRPGPWRSMTSMPIVNGAGAYGNAGAWTQHSFIEISRVFRALRPDEFHPGRGRAGLHGSSLDPRDFCRCFCCPRACGWAPCTRGNASRGTYTLRVVKERVLRCQGYYVGSSCSLT